MVSGVTDVPTKYKSKKNGGGFFPPQHHQSANGQLAAVSSPPHHPNSNKRFSDSDLRPWPPMYNTGSVRPTDENFRSIASSKHSPNYKNTSASTNGKSSNGQNNYSIYERNKFNFHNGKSVTSSSSAVSSNGSQINNGNNNNNHHAKDYYMLSQPYVMNSLSVPSDGSVYGGRDPNLLMAAKEREKNRFRKLRFVSDSGLFLNRFKLLKDCLKEKFNGRF